jgi:signal transduction histidine kinase
VVEIGEGVGLTAVPESREATFDRAFRSERAETMRTRLRWIWGAALGIWILSFIAFDLAAFTSRTHAAMVRVPECTVALLSWLWLRRRRSLLSLEVLTVIAWSVIAGVTAYGLSLVPPDRLPFKAASFSLSVLVVCPLVSLRWQATAAIGVVTVLALSTLRFLGENTIFMATMTVVGFAYLVLIASATARDRLVRRELESRLGLAEANEKLRRDDELRRRLFTNLSHDLRTPLAVVHGEAELLRSHARSNDDAQALGRISANARALADLAAQLIDLARLEAGQLQHKPKSCDVARCARDLTAALAPPAGRGARFLTARTNDAEEIVARVDPQHLARILTNLVANGLRHARTSVTVSPRREREHVVIDVTDDGPGIPSERREAIFQRFVSFDSDGSTTSGIGLPLARELATLNGGSLELIDDASATIFRLTLKASAEPAEDIALNARASLTTGDSPVAPAPVLFSARGTTPTRRVLVVEDHEDMATLLGRVLAGRFDVEHVSSVATALARLEKSPVDAVLSDVLLPDGTGYDILAAVRSRRDLATLPFVLVSALGAPEEHVRGLGAGADDYVSKPFAPEELEKRLALALERADARKRALDEQRDALLMEIHDGVSGSLSRAAMLLRQDPNDPTFDGAREAIADGLEEVRAIARLLAPRASSFDALVAETRRAMADACSAASITLEFASADHSEAVPLSPQIAHALRRAAREATTNVLKHAGARRMKCTFSADAEVLRLSIEDDGRGFPPSVESGQGLGIMERRAARVGGRIERGNRPNGGAFVELTFPRTVSR